MALIASFSGVRGKYPQEMDARIALRYAAAFSEGRKRVVMGRDTRESGETLRDAMLEGLEETIDVGVLPTPAIEEAVRHFRADGGIIITASHNEPDENGLKFLGKDGGVLRPEEMEQLISRAGELLRMEEREFSEKHLLAKCLDVGLRHEEAREAYGRFLSGFFSADARTRIREAGLRVVVDANGGAGRIAKAILETYGIRVFETEKPFWRAVEPTADSLRPLAKEILSHKAAFAAGFDCDADRVEILLGDGSLADGNHLLALIVDSLLSPGEMVVVNDATSYLVKEVVEEHQGVWAEAEVGETNVVRMMEARNARVGGEGSNGGVILAPSRCRDGILTLLKLCEILATRKKTLPELMEALPSYTYLKEKVKGELARHRENARKHFLSRGFTLQETGEGDGGLKAVGEHGWVWMRQSRTESGVVRIIADSKDAREARSLLREAKGLLS